MCFATIHTTCGFYGNSPEIIMQSIRSDIMSNPGVGKNVRLGQLLIITKVSFITMTHVKTHAKFLIGSKALWESHGI